MYGSWIDARTLHKELKVGKKFTDWIKGRIDKYEFIELEDWKLTNHKIGKRSNVKVDDYSLTLDMAKELCMVENFTLDNRTRVLYNHKYNNRTYV